MRKLLTALTLAAAFTATAQAADPSEIVTYSKAGKFADVREDVKLAIENRALVIDYISHIHTMLERTGKDLGTPKKIFTNGEAFTFCSAVYSRKTMEADPHNIAFCPYAISVYTTAKEPNKVHVSYRRPWRADGSAASRAALKDVENLLDGIVREALNIKK